MEWYYVALACFGGLLFLLLLGIPVSFSLLTVALAGSVLMGGGVLLIADLPARFFDEVNSFVMTCVPLFILMAMIIEAAGFARLMFDAVKAWLSKLPGALAIVATVACTIFAAVCGSSAATAAAVGVIAIPEFKRTGCDRRLSVGAVAAGGSLGILIPPSVPMIFYCIITEVSIGQLFIAGILPGIMTSFFFVSYIYTKCRLNPNLIPMGSPVSWKERWRSLTGLAPISIIIALVISVIYFGIATPTEAAAVGCFGAMALGFITRQLTLSAFGRAILNSIKLNGFLLLIVLGAICFGVVLNRGDVTTGFCQFIVGLGLSKWAVLVIINFLFLILGCFLDPTPIILTTMPILFPLSQAFGFNPIWFGIMAIMNLEMAAITPPVGFNLFVLKGIAREYVSTAEIVVGAIPFGLLYMLALIIVIIFPQIPLFLPGLMK